MRRSLAFLTPSSDCSTSESVVCSEIHTVVRPPTTEAAGSAMMNHGQNCLYHGVVSSRLISQREVVGPRNRLSSVTTTDGSSAAVKVNSMSMMP